MNSRRMVGFDRIAKYYDRLAWIVYGSSIRNAQLYYLNSLKPGGSILIIGGGTGWILTELMKVNPRCEVWYIDASQSMLERARGRTNVSPQASIHFIHGTEDSIPDDIRFDAVLANFFFDMFSPQSLNHVVQKVRAAMARDGLLLVSEFMDNKSWWHKVLLWLMYRLFRLSCGIEATQLPDWNESLQKQGLEELVRRDYFGDFIRSSVYRVFGNTTRDDALRELTNHKFADFSLANPSHFLSCVWDENHLHHSK